MSVFDEIKVGLNEAIEYEKGNSEAKTKVLSVKEPTAGEKKDNRKNEGLTQKH